MAGAKAENYYKVLGTRSNIKQENIKKKYIEMVKKFPPETHPEQFERIREAYEVLRDPKKRHEYDAMRKHGNKIEKLMEKGEAYVQTEEWEQARSIYQQAVNIMPDSISARMGLAGALLHLHDVDAFEEQYTHILPLIPEGMEIPVYMSRAMIYMEIGKPEKAYDIFKDTCERFPDRIYESLRILVSAYLVADLDEEAWELLVSHLPDPGQEKAEDIHLFIFWVHTMARLNKWNLWSQLQTRIRKFLKTLADEESKRVVLEALNEQVDMLYEAGVFRLSEIFIDFMYFIDPKDRAVKERRTEIQHVMRLEKELHRMFRDSEMFPLVMYEAERYFNNTFIPLVPPPEPEEEMPADILYELQEMDIEYLAGITRVKKKYPLLYRQFKEKWEQLYDAHSQDLSREVRRQFRI